MLTKKIKQKVLIDNVSKEPWNKGLTKETDERVRKQSDSLRGRTLSKEHKHKLSKANKGKEKRELHTEETKQKISIALKGNKNWLGKHHSKEAKQKMSKANKGKVHTEETRLKLRIAAMNRMINNNIFPCFNKTSIQYFDILNKVIFNGDGQYGINEYCIPEIGYWPDFVSHKYKIIIEYDETYHNRQIEKDAIRQARIQSYYPDYAFIRIKEENAKINILANLFAKIMETEC